jgi:integrase
VILVQSLTGKEKQMKISEPVAKSNRKAKWQLSIWLNGRQVRRFFQTREEAREGRNRMLDSHNRGRLAEHFPEIARKLHYTPPPTDTLRWDVLEQIYLEDCGKRQHRQATIDGARGTLRRCREYLRNPFVADLTRNQIIMYITQTGGTEKSRASLRGQIVSFLSWCGEMGYCERAKFHGLKWPVIRSDIERPLYLSVEEISRLFQFTKVYLPAGNGCALKIDKKKTIRFKAALACAIFLGIRPGSQAKGGGRYGELPMLKFDDFNLERNLLVIPAKISKTRSERIITDLPSNVRALVEAGNYQAGDYIMPFGYERFRANIKRIRKDVEEAGFPPLTWCQKIFRHTFGTYGYWRGLEWVIEAGGWQDPRMLTKYYRGGCEKEVSQEAYSLNLLDSCA